MLEILEPFDVDSVEREGYSSSLNFANGQHLSMELDTGKDTNWSGKLGVGTQRSKS